MATFDVDSQVLLPEEALMWQVNGYATEKHSIKSLRSIATIS